MTKISLKFSLACTLAGIFLVALTSCSLNPRQPADVQQESATVHEELQPDPNLSPEEVVKIQVEALKNNDEEDKGIEITFRFASPANKQATGPLARFKRMVKNPAYSPMLNHKLAEYGPIEISGDTATQRVTIIESNGNATVYLFTLSKQNEPSCKGCWMTDSVTVVPVKKQNLQGA